MTGFFTAPRIAWGPGAIEQLSGLGARRAVVLVDRAVASAEGQRRVVEELAKSETSVESMALSEAPDRIDRIEELVAQLGARVPEWIVVVGGGRAIDAAKALRLRLERPDAELATLTPMLDLPDPPLVRLAAIPTTSGSGSEASGAVDLWSTDGAPVELAHRGLTPDWALVDPGFTSALTSDLLRDGAFETAAQSLEAYLSAWANPYSDALAVDALATVIERLPHALRWSDDPEAKALLHYAATAAGLAASNSQRGVAHALARALVGPTGLSYARLLGIVLLPVLEFDRPSARDRLEALTTAVMRGEGATRVPLSTRISRLIDTFRAPTDLPHAGVAPERVDPQRSAIVADVLRSPAVLANPRVPSAEDVERLLDLVLGRPRPS
jgi:alcohol dehydrogenase class IV